MPGAPAGLAVLLLGLGQFGNLGLLDLVGPAVQGLGLLQLLRLVGRVTEAVLDVVGTLFLLRGQRTNLLGRVAQRLARVLRVSMPSAEGASC